MSQEIDQTGWISRLPNRSVLSIKGPDSTAFLQGLISNDMGLFRQEGRDRAAIFASFLNVKGKVLFDAILAKPRLANQDGDDVEYWVDVAEYDQEAVMKHLKVRTVI